MSPYCALFLFWTFEKGSATLPRLTLPYSPSYPSMCSSCLSLPVLRSACATDLGFLFHFSILFLTYWGRAVIRSLRARVAGVSWCGCWELNSGPLEEQKAFLTAESSLPPYKARLLIVLIQNTWNPLFKWNLCTFFFFLLRIGIDDKIMKLEKQIYSGYMTTVLSHYNSLWQVASVTQTIT